jgi:hypothetical protein
METFRAVPDFPRGLLPIGDAICRLIQFTAAELSGCTLGFATIKAVL